MPKGLTRTEAGKLETKMRSDLLFEANGMKTRDEVIFEHFVNDVYLPHVLANNGQAAFNRAELLCIQSLPFFNGRQLRLIKPSDIEALKFWRMKLPTMHGKERMPATIARELTIISKLFSLAVKNDLIDYNPCSRVEKPRFDNVQDTVLRREDEAKFFASFDPLQGDFAVDVCRIVLNTGLRQSDVLGLTKFHINLHDRTLTRVQGKTQRRVIHCLNDEVFPIVERRMKLKSSLLFPSPKNGKQALSVKSAIAGACRRAEIDKVTIRDLRRTVSSRLEDMGFSATDIAKFLGHSDLRSVHRYMRSVERKREVAKSLESGKGKHQLVTIR